MPKLSAAEHKRIKAETLEAARKEARHVAQVKGLDAQMTGAVVDAAKPPLVAFHDPYDVHFLGGDATAVKAAVPDAIEEAAAVDNLSHVTVDCRHWNEALVDLQAAGHVVSVVEFED